MCVYFHTTGYLWHILYIPNTFLIPQSPFLFLHYWRHKWITFLYWCSNKLLFSIGLLSSDEVCEGKGTFWGAHHPPRNTTWEKERGLPWQISTKTDFKYQIIPWSTKSWVQECYTQHLNWVNLVILKPQSEISYSMLRSYCCVTPG